ncbi:MAG: phosphoribosylanthranilate isomerase [Anaerolineae bacterium]|nr:phosphoribosylanthranilate isomerase [Phycisphaerae bacterium]
MHRTRVKICGITRPEDAAAAVEAGADAIGMILHANAPRKISKQVADDIVSEVADEVEVVGVFADAPLDLIVEMANELELDQVQLHGSEAPDIMSALAGVTVIKAIRGRDDINAELSRWRDIVGVRALLLETGGGSYAGGNGIESDWDALAALLEGPSPLDRNALVVAGGLRAENVANVIRRLRPWSVDVSSGVERLIGVKSIEKMRAFCAAVRAADQSI